MRFQFSEKNLARRVRNLAKAVKSREILIDSIKSTMTTHTHIRQSPAPLQLLARLTITLSDSGVR